MWYYRVTLCPYFSCHTLFRKIKTFPSEKQGGLYSWWRGREMGFHHRQAVENPWVLQPLLPRPGSFYHTDLVGVLRNLSVLFRAYFDAFGIYSTFDFFF